MVVAKLFQLFQPIGGRGASILADLVCAAIVVGSIDAAAPAMPEPKMLRRLIGILILSLSCAASIRAA
ncbi:hypothetical protein GCM10009102_33060 [Sphingomonas insulae]|uniref:Uncharacterized protein n=1 Tax=Sphingomonas insulae TaxID=424800 RepID=A0ABN1I0I9_9SPHN